MSAESLEDLLDLLVADYSDRLGRGEAPDRASVLARVPSAQRPGLERCLKMIEAGSAQVPSTTVLGRGARLGRYEILRELGRGGMSIVFLARDHELQRPVALKVLRPGLALEGRHAERFHREALTVAKLKHPHVVPVFDVGVEGGLHYLAMEFIEGPSLATVLEALPADRDLTAEDLARAIGTADGARQGGSFTAAVAALLTPVAEALAVAHDLGLVHRDVKPSNLLLHADGRAVVADFGLAKGDGDPALSLTGTPLGTPHYMSPEQALASDVHVDHRTDVYSLGVTLYEALSGRRPYEGDSVFEILDAIRNLAPPALRGRDRRGRVDAAAVARRAMARDPEQRYASMRALAEDLASLAAGSPTRARAKEGGRLRRALGQLQLARSGCPYEYRSERTVLGLPLVHVNIGRSAGGRSRRARGWLAIGHVASGGLAIGHVAFGGISLGAGLACGLFAVGGGLSVGLLSAFAGGVALGALASAGLAVGGLAIGGVALGYAAIGGMARGHYAAGGDAAGTHVLSNRAQDPEAEAFFSQWMPWITDALRPGG